MNSKKCDKLFKDYINNRRKIDDQLENLQTQSKIHLQNRDRENLKITLDQISELGKNKETLNSALSEYECCTFINDFNIEYESKINLGKQKKESLELIRKELSGKLSDVMTKAVKSVDKSQTKDFEDLTKKLENGLEMDLYYQKFVDFEETSEARQEREKKYESNYKNNIKNIEKKMNSDFIGNEYLVDLNNIRRKITEVHKEIGYNFVELNKLKEANERVYIMKSICEYVLSKSKLEKK
jgi:hypothetical protein